MLAHGAENESRRSLSRRRPSAPCWHPRASPPVLTACTHDARNRRSRSHPQALRAAPSRFAQANAFHADHAAAAGGIDDPVGHVHSICSAISCAIVFLLRFGMVPSSVETSYQPSGPPCSAATASVIRPSRASSAPSALAQTGFHVTRQEHGVQAALYRPPCYGISGGTEPWTSSPAPV